MHRAHLGDLQQSGPLRLGQRPGELEGPIHSIQLSRFRFALGTVGRMNPGMPQPHHDLLERPCLSSRVQRDRHRRSTAQCRKQEVVRSRAGIGAAVRDRFVRDHAMRAGRDLLGESASRAANDDFCLVHIAGGHRARIVRLGVAGQVGHVKAVDADSGEVIWNYDADISLVASVTPTSGQRRVRTRSSVTDGTGADDTRTESEEVPVTGDRRSLRLLGVVGMIEESRTAISNRRAADS